MASSGGETKGRRRCGYLRRFTAQVLLVESWRFSVGPPFAPRPRHCPALRRVFRLATFSECVFGRGGREEEEGVYTQTVVFRAAREVA